MEHAPTPHEPIHARVAPVLIEDELRDSFLDYAMSVIVSRAIPDVRDGLKPVHRRVLYAMHQLGFTYNKPYHKSARVVGDVLGKYHPHGESAVYQTMVGMVQDFSKRYPLLDGQGNWGSVDGDAAAATRYTEVRMQRIAQELLADLDKETVPFTPNFDESLVEPTVLPSKLPHLLVNGTTGIAVGMATSMLPHNLGEVVDACLALLKNPELGDDELFKLVPGPDFPTGGIIYGRGGIYKAYTTGRGSVVVRAVVAIEETKRGAALVVTELPYQVIKSDLIVKIADLVKDKVIDGITNIRDESDRRGMRLVIEIRKGEQPQVILNQLFKHTPLQSNFPILQLALLHNRPLIFTLRQLISEFLLHRETVIHKRTQFDLNRARARYHILEGFIRVLQDVERVIALIKGSAGPEEALEKLHAELRLTAEQGKAVLELRLQRLTGMEQEKIRAELGEVNLLVEHLTAILADRSKLHAEIAKELTDIRATYADARRTRIEAALDAFEEADLIPDEEVVVTLTRKGYIKRVPLAMYQVQHRGGKGKMGMADLEASDDVMQDIFAARNHDELLFFTNQGRVYSLSVYEVPEASRTAKGRAVVNLLSLGAGEQVVKLLCARDLAGQFLVMATKQGTIKRTEATEFSNIRSTGIRAITLHEGDELVCCALSSGKDTIVLATELGRGIRFAEHEVRAMGRQAAGVIGIRPYKGDAVISMEVVPEQADLLFATEFGYGKRVNAADFRIAHRGGHGVRTIPTDKRNGKVVGLAVVDDLSDILLIDEAGKLIRLDAKEVRTMGRQAKGVRLIRLDTEQKLLAVVAIPTTAQAEETAAPEAGVNAV